MPNKPILIPFDKVTPEMLANDLLALKITVYHLLQQLTNEVYEVDSPEDLEERYDLHFKIIEQEVKKDNNALNNPDKLQHIPLSDKRLFAITSLLQSLLPPDPSKIQIVKPN